MKYYDKERSEFQNYGKLQVVGQSEVTKIVNKLCRHFKVPKLETVFRKHHPNTGTCFRDGVVSFHPKIVSILIICHEVGHWMDQLRNNPKKWHTKKHRTCVKRLLRYCDRMNYWGWAFA